MSKQSHPSSARREPAGSGAVPSVVLGRLVNPTVPMALEWNWGDPLPYGLVFTGDANRTKIDANGVVHTVGANVPRNDGYVFDKNGILQPAWLLEASSTNLCLQSANLASGSWFKVGTGSSTFTAPTTIAPDGTSRAVGQFRVTTPSDTVGQNATISGATAGRSYTVSIWMRLTPSGAGSGSVRLRVAEFGGATGQTQTEAVVQPTATWQRFTVTRTFVQNDRTGVQINMLGNVALSDIQVWGGQIEQLGFASSYISTTTAAVTRAAEIATAPWYRAPQPTTMYAKVVECGNALFTAYAPGVLALTDAASSAPRFFMYYAVPGYGALHGNGTGTVSVAESAIPVLGDTVELLATLAASGAVSIGQSMNGGAETDVTSAGLSPLAAAWSSTLLRLNDRGTATPGYVAFESIRLALGAYTMNQMRKVATDPSRVTPATTGVAVASLVNDGTGRVSVSSSDLTGTGRIAVVRSRGVIY